MQPTQNWDGCDGTELVRAPKARSHSCPMRDVSEPEGMWMGEVPPLGYDVRDRRLVVNRPEAVTVKHIYERYLELGSVRLLRNDLKCREIVSKV